MKLPDNLQKLIQYLKRFPGVGYKSAERFAFQLLKWPSHELTQFANQLQNLHKFIQNCSICGCIKNNDKCFFCNNPDRDSKLICIVSNPRDVFSIEQTKSYSGLYHVFEQTLSPIDNQYPESSELEKITQRIQTLEVKEVLLALDSTLIGDATSLYIKDKLESENIIISRLAFGVPIGSSLEFIDEGTLARSLIGRQNF